MKTIQILGSGCANCQRTYDLIARTAEEKGVEVDLQKVEDIAEIMSMGVMSTPGVAIDGKVVHSGSMPSPAQVADWLAD